MEHSMQKWINKVAIVTGASSGIGAAIAEKLVEEGLQVVGFARRSELIVQLGKRLSGKKGKLFAVKVDITKEEDILEGFKWVADNVGPVSILINNAGIVQPTDLISGDTQMWKNVIDTNVMGLCISTREAIKVMRGNKIDGHIIHINSICGHGLPKLPNLNVYPASKHAVTALTETLRQELNQLKLKIKITSISPGLVMTEIIQHAKEILSPDLSGVLNNSPYLEPEDIANSILYVLSTPPRVQVHELIIKPVGESI